MVSSMPTSEMLAYLKFDDDGAMWFADFHGAWKYFFHDCDEATARWAFERLGPERFGDTTVTPVSVPRFWAADLPRSFILCLQDRSMPLAGQHSHPPSRRRAADHRHVTLPVPPPASGAGRATRARDDHQPHGSARPPLVWRAGPRVEPHATHVPAVVVDAARHAPVRHCLSRCHVRAWRLNKISPRTAP